VEDGRDGVIDADAGTAGSVDQDRGHPQIFGRHQVARHILDHNALLAVDAQDGQGSVISQRVRFVDETIGNNIDNFFKVNSDLQPIQDPFSVGRIGVGENDLP
jgi:hypothetical protein